MISKQTRSQEEVTEKQLNEVVTKNVDIVVPINLQYDPPQCSGIETIDINYEKGEEQYSVDEIKKSEIEALKIYNRRISFEEYTSIMDKSRGFKLDIIKKTLEKLEKNSRHFKNKNKKYCKRKIKKKKIESSETVTEKKDNILMSDIKLEYIDQKIGKNLKDQKNELIERISSDKWSLNSENSLIDYIIDDGDSSEATIENTSSKI